MSIARERALEVRQRHRLIGYVSGEQLSEVLRHYHLEIKHHLFRGNVREVLHGRRIWLHSELEPATERWLTGHALAHFLLHRGNHLETVDMAIIAKHECQAELFTGWLFLADVWYQSPTWELAEMSNLPQQRIERWLSLMRGERAVSGGW